MMLRTLAAGLILMLLPLYGHATELKPLQRGSYAQILALHQGKPLIVALWSLSCSYCSTELSMLRDVLKSNSKVGLVLIATDTPSDRSAIQEALGKLGLAGRQSWVFGDTPAERLRYEIDPEWYGELPRSYLYSANGEVQGISGVMEEAELKNWLKRQTTVRPIK